ncbi:hypothetical protein BT93_A1831 [Corymbia citriodora subsp. variegata]|nr:hypothetical protein BT93_A1831 [Corymbia citriodora subsp. variegata]
MATEIHGDGDDSVRLLQSATEANSQRKGAVAMSPETSSALSLFMLDPRERDAVLAREALERGETDYRALVEIFLGRKSSHIQLIRQAYQRKFRRQLEQDIIKIEPPHAFQRILRALATSHKAHQADVSQHLAKCDARRLYETGEGSPSGAIEEAVVLEIVSKRSIPQLKRTFLSYRHIYGHDYSESLKKEGATEFAYAFRMVVKCISNAPKYYAKMLHTSLNGRAINKSALTRVMVSRAELDMTEIRRAFKRKYGVEIQDCICQSIACGDYRDFLVALATKTPPAPSSSDLLHGPNQGSD